LPLPANPIPAPTQVETRAGNIFSVADRTDIPDLHIGDGQFRPEPGGTGGIIELCGDTTKTIDTPTGVVDVAAFGFWEGDKCSQMSGPDTYDNTRSRVVAKLERSTAYYVEEGLWTGSPTAVPSSSESVLASTAADDINGGILKGIVPAMSDMIDALNDALRGSRGVVHVPQSLIPFLEFYGMVTRTGNVLQVAGTDHVYVAGAGYPNTDPDGSAPDAGEWWIYGTGAVNVRLGPVGGFPSQPFEALDRSINLVEVRAERAALAYFDPTAHIAVAVCTPDPGPACATSS